MHSLLPALAAYLPRDRVESLLHPDSSLPQEGVALIADISGFTPLTEALTQHLSPDEGAEVLTHALDSVFMPLIEEIHAFRGSVIKFSGDALIVWYGREPKGRLATLARRALTSAWRMQQVMRAHGQIQTPIGPVTLRMKIGMSTGRVQRLNLGSPEHGYEDVFVGATLERMTEAEHHAEPGDVVLAAETQALVGEAASVAEWRDDFAVVGGLVRPMRRHPWPPLTWEPAMEPELLQRLAAYLPAALYETLLAGRTQVAELKPVVSLFVQFHGLDYDRDPESAAKLQRYFECAQRIVARYEGRLNRLITGDKGNLLHIIFGAPRTVEEQEARAIRCALELQAECGALPFITMQRIGVAAGRAFAGPVGSPERHDYTTMGDIINLSARLMQNAGDHQILLERTVCTPLGAEFQVESLGSIRVKGKSEPIPVFAALGVTRRLRRAPQTQTLPLFGREEELASLQVHLERLAQGRGQCVVLLGEAGVGKTLLLDTLRSRATAPWAGGICLAYGQSLSGYLFVGLLRDLLRLPAGAGAEESQAALAALCAQLFGAVRGEAAYLYLARFMGLPLQEAQAQQLEGLSGESFRWQLFEIIQSLFRRLLTRQPLVLALDDLQWADATSLHLIELLLPLTKEGPLLLLLSMRPDRQSRAWTLYQRLEPGSSLDLPLGPLDERAASALVRYFAPQLPAHLLTHLLDKAGGNPLFLVELVRTLQVQGLLEDQEALAGLPVEALNLPDSVQGLLLAQIDRLAVEARHTLQLAAVIGRRFFYQVLEAISEAAARLDESLTTLEAGSYIQPELQPSALGRSYLFRHSLIQESAYSTLLYERRRGYHQAVAEALERLFPTLIGEQAGLLAFHYEHAGDLEQALYFHLHAADQARLLYANEEAEALYRKSLALLEQQEAERGQPDLERRAKTYLKLAQLRANTLDFVGAQEFYDLAFDLLEQVERAAPLSTRKQEEQRVFRLGVFEHGPLTLDPGLSEIEDSCEIVGDLFEGLVELDVELNIVPAAARRWQVEEGGRRYRFDLRPNLRWSDGTPLTAHDFVFAWQRNLHPETGAGLAYLLYPVEGAEAYHQGLNSDPNSVGIRALSDTTLEMTLLYPTGYFLYLLDSSIAFPQPIHKVRLWGAEWSNADKLVCNGPFRISSWHHGQAITLERNPFYWVLLREEIGKVLLHFVEPTFEAYLEEQVDWCRSDTLTTIPAEYAEQTLLVQHLQTFFIGFSCSSAPFNRKEIRQAFAHSLDRKELVQVAWDSLQKAATGGAVPPGMLGHSPEINLPFDPSTARVLLDSVRQESELPPIVLASSTGFNLVPQYLQQSWDKHLGLQVQVIENVPIDEILSNLRQGTIHMALFSWQMDYPDPDNILRALFHSASPINYFGWAHHMFDELVEQAARSTEQQERLALYRDADRILVREECAATPLYYRQAYGLLRPPYQIAEVTKVLRNSRLRLKHIRRAEPGGSP